MLAMAALPSAASAQADDDRFEEIDEYVQEQIDGSRIPAVALAIVEDGETVHMRGFGDDAGEPVTPQTPFPIGSLTKSFTALAVMQLAEAGELDLDAPVQNYIPEFRVADQAASSQITVRHLLNQTSGFSRQSGLAPLVEEWDGSGDDLIQRLQDVELNRPVGESYDYSNLNYLVLGQVIERVSGQTYGDYVRQHIFEPLGMSNSYVSHEEGRQHDMVAVHRYWFGFPVETETPHLPGQISAGFLVSSAEDMSRYLAMYLNGGEYGGERILSAEGITTMHQPATEEFERTLLGTDFSARYGMGWFSGPFGEESALWHLGELPAFNAWMVLLPESDQAVVVLINASNQIGLAGSNEVFSRIPIGITNLLTGHEPPTGLGLTRFYVFFDLIVLGIVAVLVWRLLQLYRRPLTVNFRPRSLRNLMHVLQSTVPLLWEFGLSLVILFGYPTLAGLGWQGAFWAVPDLSLVLLALAGLWLLTGMLRVYKLIRGLTGSADVGSRSPTRDVARRNIAQDPALRWNMPRSLAPDRTSPGSEASDAPI